MSYIHSFRVISARISQGISLCVNKKPIKMKFIVNFDYNLVITLSMKSKKEAHYSGDDDDDDNVKDDDYDNDHY